MKNETRKYGMINLELEVDKRDRSNFKVEWVNSEISNKKSNCLKYAL